MHVRRAAVARACFAGCRGGAGAARQVEPGGAQQLLSASADGSLAVWDLRKLGPKAKALATAGHAYTCQSAYFAPDGEPPRAMAHLPAAALPRACPSARPSARRGRRRGARRGSWVRVRATRRTWCGAAVQTCCAGPLVPRVVKIRVGWWPRLPKRAWLPRCVSVSHLSRSRVPRIPRGRTRGCRTQARDASCPPRATTRCASGTARAASAR